MSEIVCDPHIIGALACTEREILYLQHSVALKVGCPTHGPTCPLLSLPELTRWQRIKSWCHRL